MSTDTLSKNLGAWKAQIANVKARLPRDAPPSHEFRPLDRS
jgi:hypothetical protein